MSQCAEIIALQARLLLFHEGDPGSLTIRRLPDGKRRVEIEYAGKGADELYSVRGGLIQVGHTLAQVGTEFHQIDQ